MKMVFAHQCVSLVTILEFLLLLGVAVAASSSVDFLQSPAVSTSDFTSRPGERRLTTTTTVVWCIARSNVSDVDLQNALDWACGPLEDQGQVNCGPISVGGACFDPDTTFHHSSYAFNEFFLKSNASLTACDFSGSATISNVNPSSGTCEFQGSNVVVDSNLTDIIGAPPPASSPVVAPAFAPQPGATPRIQPTYVFGTSTVLTLLTYFFT